MPIVASMGGNAGMQTLAVTIRTIATNELTKNNFSQNIIKEFFIGILNGIIFAIISAIVVQLWFNDITLIINYIYFYGFKHDSCWIIWNFSSNNFKKI